MKDSAGKIFHSNENYTVRVNMDATGYEVVNSNSDVVEFESQSLPESIFAAENMNVVFTHRSYEWVAKRANDHKAEAASPLHVVKPKTLQ